MSLQAIPPPGLAILPQYIPSNPTTITLKSKSFSSTTTATIVSTPTPTPLFTITSESMSLSHRQSIIDSNTNQKLFEVRKDGLGSKRYFAELSEDGPKLFETETHTRLLHRPKTAVRFANQADTAGRGMAELEFTPAGMGEDGSFALPGGGIVCVVQKISMRLDGEYRLEIAPGLDMALVVAVMMAMIDRAKTQSSGATAGGVAAGAGGGGGAC